MKAPRSNTTRHARHHGSSGDGVKQLRFEDPDIVEGPGGDGAGDGDPHPLPHPHPRPVHTHTQARPPSGKKHFGSSRGCSSSSKWNEQQHPNPNPNPFPNSQSQSQSNTDVKYHSYGQTHHEQRQDDQDGQDGQNRNHQTNGHDGDNGEGTLATFIQRFRHAPPTRYNTTLYFINIAKLCVELGNIYLECRMVFHLNDFCSSCCILSSLVNGGTQYIIQYHACKI